jgi:hypothetical protein
VSGSARGQASVEAVALVPLLALVVAGLVQLLLVAWAGDRAARVAAQAAVLVAEGRRVPPSVRAGGAVRVHGASVTAAVDVPRIVPFLPAVTVRRTARLR